MPQYRVEISPNNRAGCKDSVCQKEKVKILKGEIRFGTWVEIQDHGSWSWKHWGCVSGAQLLHLQEACDLGDGKYDFDAIDGYDELSDPEVQQKISRCVKQGFIDPEDFNGDPEKNKLGQKGIHLTAKQKADKEKEEAAAEAAEDEEASEDAKPAKKAAKRGRKKEADDDDDDEPKAKKPKPAKPAKVTKADKATPAKASRAKKPVVKNESEAEEEEDEGDLVPNKERMSIPTKTSRGRKAAVKDESEEEEEEEETPVPAKGSKSARVGSSKAKVKASPPTKVPVSRNPVKTSRGKKSVVKDESEEEEKAPASAKKSKATPKRTKTADTKATARSSRKSGAGVPADEAADEKAAPKAKGRRTSRSNKA